MTLDSSAIERGRWIYSAWKHLRNFAAPTAAAFEATALAGKACDLLGRMRELEPYSQQAIMALAKDCSISRPEFNTFLVPLLETLGILHVERSGADLHTIAAVVVSEEDVMGQTCRIWDALQPEAVEDGAILLLREAANLPLTHEEAVEACIGHGLDEEEAERSIELSTAHDLLRCRLVPDLRTAFYYNDFLWGENIDRTAQALAALPTSIRRALKDLMIELHEHEGRSLDDIESASPDVVDLAVAKGIIDATEITTTEGKKARFHFTPRFQGFGVSRDDRIDSLDQVKLVIASMSFASKYAKWRLNDPELFLQTLIARGYAGNATPIGTDYGAMERQKIVDVEPTGDGDKHRFKAVKRDTLIEARDCLVSGGLLIPNSRGRKTRFQPEPHRFSDPVSTRHRLGQQPGSMPLYDSELLAGIREASRRDSF